MKIFVVSRGLPSEINRILGIFEMDQAKALQEMGHDIVFLSVDLRSFRRKRPFGFNSYLREGIRIEEASIPLGRVPKAALLFFGKWGFRRIFSKAVKKYGRPDLVHSHFADVACMVTEGLKGTGISHIITEHSSQLNGQLDEYDMNVYRNAYETADGIITVSSALQKRLEELFGVKSRCIHNIVDLDIFTYEERKKKDEFTFISVGGLTPIKNTANTIKAFAEVASEKEDVKLIIVGDGPERQNLEQLASELSIDGKVEFTGMLTRARIHDYHLGADCFVLPSKSETFGVAYIEAMASGLPVIASRCGGPEDFVTEENGILIPENTVDDLARAMMHMYENHSNYNGKCISEEVRERFSGRNIAGQIDEFYKSKGVVNE
ncbi:MAG: glycosyltransferase [Firmicutes bacterium]|nr:glycosyltransferase [Bacillota bacterium]